MAVSVGSTVTTSTSDTFSHTVNTADDRVLVVVAQSTTGSASGITGITFDGNSLTKAVGLEDNDRFSEIWYLINPDEKTANVVVSGTALTDSQYGAVNLEGIAQTSPVGDTDTATPNKSASLTLTVEGSEGICVDSWNCQYQASQSPNAPTIGSGQTEIFSTNPGSGSGDPDTHGASYETHSGSNVTMSQSTNVDPTDSSYVTAEFKGASVFTPKAIIF